MVTDTQPRRRRLPATSVQLAPDQQRRLAILASERRISRSALIRQAVDLLLADDDRRAGAPASAAPRQTIEGC